MAMGASQPHQKALSILFGIGVVVAILFLTLVGYYIWQFKYGNPLELAEKYEPRFTRADGKAVTTQVSDAIRDVKSVVRDENPRFGNPNATVQIVAFIDFECPFCARSYPVFEEIRETYAPAVEIVFKHLPLNSIHPKAMPAALASTCANDQGTFWSYYKRLFESGSLDTNALIAHAKALGLNERTFKTCLDNQTHRRVIDQDIEDAFSLRVAGTPTYFVNNKKVEGVLERTSWDTLILDTLKNL